MNKDKEIIEFINKILYFIFYVFLKIFERLTFNIWKIFYQINKKLENKAIDIHFKFLLGD